MTQKVRSRKNLKIGIGVFILIVGISYIPMQTPDYEPTIEHIITAIAWMIVGILIILGTGKIMRIRK